MSKNDVEIKYHPQVVSSDFEKADFIDPEANPLSRFQREIAEVVKGIMMQMAPPMVLGLWGPPSSGKSAILHAVQRILNEAIQDDECKVKITDAFDLNKTISPNPEENLSKSINGLFPSPDWGLIDGIDRLTPDGARICLNNLDRIVQSTKPDKPRRYILAADNKRLLELLIEATQSSAAADHLLMAVVSHKYLIPRPKPKDAIDVFWKEEVDENNEKKDENKSLPTELLRNFARYLIVRDLRRARQFSVTLRVYYSVFKGSYDYIWSQVKNGEIENLIRQKEQLESDLEKQNEPRTSDAESSHSSSIEDIEQKLQQLETDIRNLTEKKKAVMNAVFQASWAYHAALREWQPDVYNEWAEKACYAELSEKITNMLLQIEELFASNRAGYIPTFENDRALEDIRQQFIGSGFDNTAGALQSNEFLKNHRTVRAALMNAWAELKAPPFPLYSLKPLFEGEGRLIFKGFVRFIGSK